MGEGIAGLIDFELQTVIEEAAGEAAAVFGERAEELLAARESQVVAREAELAATEEKLRGWTKRLRIWEGELQALEERTRLTSSLTQWDKVPRPPPDQG
jgi:hypothetical protein